MRVVLAVAALGVAVVAGSAHGAPPKTCAPAPAPVADPGVGFEVHLWETVTPISVTDAQHRHGADIPGVGDDHFKPYGQVEVDPGHVGSYVVAGLGKDVLPVTVQLSRNTFHGPAAAFSPIQQATWFLPRSIRGSLVTLAFATGEDMKDVRLCVAGQPLAPTTVAKTGFAQSDYEPHVSATTTKLPGGRFRVNLRATDRRSPVIGIWVIVQPGAWRMTRYRQPLVLRRGHIVNYWALDRAGNMGSDVVRVR